MAETRDKQLQLIDFHRFQWGGYAAVLTGCKLRAQLIFSFNGQWHLDAGAKRDGKVVSPVLKRMSDEQADGTKYFDIAKAEFDYPNTFYLVSSRSPGDARQFSRVAGFRNIHILRFRNSHHGIPFLKCSLPRVMNMRREELCRLERREHLPVLFDIRMAGLLPTLQCIWKILRKKIF